MICLRLTSIVLLVCATGIEVTAPTELLALKYHAIWGTVTFFSENLRNAYYCVLAKGSVFNAELGVYIVTTVLEGVK